MLKKSERKSIEELVDRVKNDHRRRCRNVQIEAYAHEECDDAVTGASHISGVSIYLYGGKCGSVNDGCFIEDIKIDRRGKDGIDTCNEVLYLLMTLGMKQTDFSPLQDIEGCGWLTAYSRFIPQEDK